MPDPPKPKPSLQSSTESQTSFSEDALETLYQRSPAEQIFSNASRLQEAIRTSTPQHINVPVAQEHNYWVGRKRDLRLKKFTKGKSGFEVGTSKAVAEAGRERVAREKKEKREREDREKLWKERMRNEELFGSENEPANDGNNGETGRGSGDPSVVMGGTQAFRMNNGVSTETHGAEPNQRKDGQPENTEKPGDQAPNDELEKSKSAITREIERMQAKADANLARLKAKTEQDALQRKLLNKKHEEAKMMKISKSIESRVKSGKIVQPPPAKKKHPLFVDARLGAAVNGEAVSSETNQKGAATMESIEQQVVDKEPAEKVAVPKRVTKRISTVDHLFIPRNPPKKRMPTREVIRIHQDEAAESTTAESGLASDDDSGGPTSATSLSADDVLDLDAPENKQAKLLAELAFDDDDDIVAPTRSRRLRDFNAVDEFDRDMSEPFAELDFDDERGVRQPRPQDLPKCGPA